MENNTGLDFENGGVLIGVVEINPPYYVKVNMTSGSISKFSNLFERLPTGFSATPGSRFPPPIQDKLDQGASLELYSALKAVDPGTYIIEPTEIKYGAKTSKSGQITITVADVRITNTGLSLRRRRKAIFQ